MAHEKAADGPSSNPRSAAPRPARVPGNSQGRDTRKGIKSVTADCSRDTKNSKLIAAAKEGVQCKGSSNTFREAKRTSHMAGNRDGLAAPSAEPTCGNPETLPLSLKDPQVNGSVQMPVKKVLSSASQNQVLAGEQDADVGDASGKSSKQQKTPPVVLKLHRMNPLSREYGNQVLDESMTGQSVSGKEAKHSSEATNGSRQLLSTNSSPGVLKEVVVGQTTGSLVPVTTHTKANNAVDSAALGSDGQSQAKAPEGGPSTEHSYHKHGKGESRHHHHHHHHDRSSSSSHHHHHSHKHKHKHKHKHHRHEEHVLPVPKVLKTGDGTSLKLKIEGLEAAKLSTNSTPEKSHERSRRHEKSSQSSTVPPSSSRSGSTSGDPRTSSATHSKEREKSLHSRPELELAVTKSRADESKQSSSSSSNARHSSKHGTDSSASNKHRSSSSHRHVKHSTKTTAKETERPKTAHAETAADMSVQKLRPVPSSKSSSSTAKHASSSQSRTNTTPSKPAPVSQVKTSTPEHAKTNTPRSSASKDSTSASKRPESSPQNFRPLPGAAAKKRKLSFEEALNTGVKKVKDEVATKMEKVALGSTATPSNSMSNKKRSSSLDANVRGKLTPKKVRIEEQVTAYLYPRRLMDVDTKGTAMATEADYALRSREKTDLEMKYGGLVHVETHPNGGASVIHSYQDELDLLTPEQMEHFTKDYFTELFREEPVGECRYVMGIVHGAAKYLPDLVEYLTQNYPEMVVKQGVLGKSDIETTTMLKYTESVHKTYSCGTYRAGALNQLSMVGTRQEEVGDYFPVLLDMMEQNPFLKKTMPWGDLSSVHGMPRNHSNDGPILWARPGEQYVPSAEMPKSPFKKKRSVGVCLVMVKSQSAGFKSLL